MSRHIFDSLRCAWVCVRCDKMTPLEAFGDHLTPERLTRGSFDFVCTVACEDTQTVLRGLVSCEYLFKSVRPCSQCQTYGLLWLPEAEAMQVIRKCPTMGCTAHLVCQHTGDWRAEQ